MALINGSLTHREAFFVRYGLPPYLCTFCGGSITGYVTGGRMGLVVHHVDGDHANNKLANLEPMHHGCHAKHHRRWNTGLKLSPEHRQRLSEAHRGLRHTPESREKIAASKRGRKRKPFTDEHRAKLAAAGRGRIQSVETRAKIGAAHKGKVLSSETRAKISATRKDKATIS